MEGFTADDVDARAGAVVAAFASAMGWTETNTRALSIITMAVQSLCELALRLPPHLAPTIFQIPSILSNEDWREAVTPYNDRRDPFDEDVGDVHDAPEAVSTAMGMEVSPGSSCRTTGPGASRCRLIIDLDHYDL